MNDILKTLDLKIHDAGWPFVAAGAAATVVLALLWSPLGWLGLAATGWVAYFFRDPDRVVPVRPGLVVSPADGKVQMIVSAPPPAELGMGDGPRPRISIFLNVFDVHVNRVPADGRVAGLHYRRGKFLNAALDKASEDNERMSVHVIMPDARDVAFVQIAGLIARRIRCDLKDGQDVRAGMRYGLIRFGSRVDVYLPPDAVPLVAVGQRAIGGETVLADLMSGEAQRMGEVR